MADPPTVPSPAQFPKRVGLSNQIREDQSYIYTKCESVIINRANWFAKHGLLEFDDAHQLSWVCVLELQETEEYDFSKQKDINKMSIAVRNRVLDYIRKDIKHRGFNQEGKKYSRILFDPLRMPTKSVEEIVHTKLLSSLVLNEILPIVPKKYTNLIYFCAVEAETLRWQYEYAQLHGISYKTVNDRMKAFRKRMRELMRQYYELRHHNHPIQLRYYKPRGGAGKRRKVQ